MEIAQRITAHMMVLAMQMILSFYLRPYCQLKVVRPKTVMGEVLQIQEHQNHFRVVDLNLHEILFFKAENVLYM